MPGEGIILCDACHKRQVTCHVCEVDDAGMRTVDLCNECFEAHQPAERKVLSQALAAARCKYCGKGPCVDWNSLTNVFGVVVAGSSATGFLCEPCTEEYNRFLLKEMEGLARNLSEAEGAAEMQRLRESGEKHMLEWVAKKRS